MILCSVSSYIISIYVYLCVGLFLLILFSFIFIVHTNPFFSVMLTHWSLTMHQSTILHLWKIPTPRGLKRLFYVTVLIITMSFFSLSWHSLSNLHQQIQWHMPKLMLKNSTIDMWFTLYPNLYIWDILVHITKPFIEIMRKITYLIICYSSY